MDSLAHALPGWVVLLDYVLGVAMWTLVGRAAMNLFLPVTSDFFFMKAFVKMTDPILRVFRPVTPGFLIDPVVPLYRRLVLLPVPLLRPALVARLFRARACSPSRLRARSPPCSTISSAAAGRSRFPPGTRKEGRDGPRHPPAARPAAGMRRRRGGALQGLCARAMRWSPPAELKALLDGNGSGPKPVVLAAVGRLPMAARARSRRAAGPAARLYPAATAWRRAGRASRPFAREARHKR